MIEPYKAKLASLTGDGRICNVILLIRTTCGFCRSPYHGSSETVRILINEVVPFVPTMLLLKDLAISLTLMSTVIKIVYGDKLENKYRQVLTIGQRSCAAHVQSSCTGCCAAFNVCININPCGNGVAILEICEAEYFLNNRILRTWYWL